MKVKLTYLILFFCLGMVHGQNIIYVYPGIDQISNAVKFEAFPGDIIELTEGDYEESQTLSIPINLTIRGSENTTVKWFVPVAAQTGIEVKANIRLENIILETDSAQCAVRNNYGNIVDGQENSVRGNNIFIRHCQFINFYESILIPDARESGIAHPVDTLSVIECLFYGNYIHQPYPRGIQVWHRQARMIRIQHCTFWHYPVGSEAMHIDGFGYAYDDSRQLTDPCGIPEYMKLIVDHCTFVDVEMVGIFVEYANEADSIKNNVFEHIADFAIKGQWCSTFNSYIDYNMAHPDIGWGCTVCQPWHYNLTNIGPHCQIIDPQFMDRENGDFRYQPGSPAIGAAKNGSDLGNKIQVWNPGTWIHEPSLVSEKLPPLTETFKLEQNYPNPFNPNTNIEYYVARSGIVKLLIYDNAGRKVRCLVNQFNSAGHHLVSWDGFDDQLRPVPSGIYFYRLQNNGQVETKKLLLVR